MDKEGQKVGTSVFKSDDIGNHVTPEYFSNVKGGKKDKEKVEKKRTRISRKTLFIILGAFAAILVIVMLVALVVNFSRPPHGSRTDEEMPTTIEEVRDKVYDHLYSKDGDYVVANYLNAGIYLKDLISDMEDLNRSDELIFAAKAFRARFIFEGGLEDDAINEALRLVKSADTEYKKYNIYSALYYMYGKKGDSEKREIYSSLLDELDVNLETEGMGGGEQDE